MDEHLSLFARPLESVSARPKRSEIRSLSTGLPVVMILTVSCVALALSARRDDAQRLPAAASKPLAFHKQTIPYGSNTPGKPKFAVKPSADATVAAPARRSLDFYTNGVSPTMFSAPVPPQPRAVAAVVPPVKKTKPYTAPTVPVQPVNPFADWAYTGTIHMGDQTTALIENSKLHEGEFVKAGDTFLGAKVNRVSDQMVTLEAGKKVSLLAKSDNLTITPLDRDAPKPQTAQATPPGQPMAQPGQPQMPTAADASAPTITLPNGRTLSGDRAQRYQRFMNRRFNQ